jgi:hypothetical protein
MIDATLVAGSVALILNFRRLSNSANSAEQAEDRAQLG